MEKGNEVNRGAGNGEVGIKSIAMGKERVSSEGIVLGQIVEWEGVLHRVEFCQLAEEEMEIGLCRLSDDALQRLQLAHDAELLKVDLVRKSLEYLYPEMDSHCFLDIATLEQVAIAAKLVGRKGIFLKEGVVATALIDGAEVLAIELPQFLELMVEETEPPPEELDLSYRTKEAQLETGAVIEVPLFVDVGDLVKVNVYSAEYTQRI